MLSVRLEVVLHCELYLTTLRRSKTDAADAEVLAE
jgi:hypothetical protein